MKKIDIPGDGLLVTTDITVLYASTPLKIGLKVVRNAFENRNYEQITTESLIKMAEFVSKNNYFEFDCSGFQQIPVLL